MKIKHKPIKKINIDIPNNEINNILEIIEKEFRGYSFDTALASFELLVRRHLGHFEDFYNLEKFRVTDERRWNAKGEIVTEAEATVFLRVSDSNMMTVGTGNGPVNAIDSALRKALLISFQHLKI